jgi:hypothetical protein
VIILSYIVTAVNHLLLRYFNMPICLYKQGFIDLSLILQAAKCHAASSPRQLQIQDPRMLYFLTYTVYFIDRYNVVCTCSKYLTENNEFYLTSDNKWRKNKLQSLQS